VALFAYLAGMILYAFEASRVRAVAVRAKSAKPDDPGRSRSGLDKAAAGAMMIGFAAQTVALLIRGLHVGRIPITTFFGYLSVLSWLIVLAYLIVLYKYRWTTLGAYVAPVAFLVIVIASLFPMRLEEQLIPALQSYWLQIHVTIALLGESAFAVGFVAGILYLAKIFAPERAAPGASRRAVVNLIAAVAIGAVLGAVFFGDPLAGSSSGAGLRLLSLIGAGAPLAVVWATATHRLVVRDRGASGLGTFVFAVTVVSLLVSGVVAGVLQRLTGFVPERGGTAVFVGAMILAAVPVFAGVWALLERNRQRLPKAALLDEVGYRSVGVGWPLFTVGALIAGAIWAHQAWGVYWSWDPKEVGSLVVWLVYALYLHARAKWGLRENWCAVTAVLGFCAAVLTLVGNLILGGLHSYGGVS